LIHVGGTHACSLSAFMAGAGRLVMSPGGRRTPAMVQGFSRLVAQCRAKLADAVPPGWALSSASRWSGSTSAPCAQAFAQALARCLFEARVVVVSA
jgi:hypothetical protein